MHLTELSIVHISSFSTIKEIRHQHKPMLYYETDCAITEQQRDFLGLVFLIYHGNTPIGTFRLLQTGHNLTLAERVSDIESLIPIREAWELERFVLKKEFRSLKNIMSIYREIALWLKNNPEINQIVSISNCRVSDLLTRTGLKVVSKNIEIDNTPSDYVLLSATVDEICKRLLKT